MMNQKRIIIITALITCFACSVYGFVTHVQDSTMKDLQFLAGTWKVENKETYEDWKLLDDGSLTGTSYRIRDGKKTISEELSIKIIDQKVTYSAKVLNQNNGEAICFELNREVAGKFSFENLSHDFPKKIQYTKVSDTSLFVEVLGDNNKGFSFKMSKEK